MAEERAEQQKPAYATNNWGAMAGDPWADVAPRTKAWRAAVKRAWLLDGGTEDGYSKLFAEPQATADHVGPVRE